MRSKNFFSKVVILHIIESEILHRIRKYIALEPQNQRKSPYHTISCISQGQRISIFAKYAVQIK